MSLPDDLSSLRAWTPTARELADLELLLSGAFAPLRGFLGAVDTATVQTGGSLADGTSWPAPVNLRVPGELAGEARLVLQDPEGVPLAVLGVTEAWPDPASGSHLVAGPVTQVREPAHGAFHGLRRTPAELDTVGLAVATREPLHRKQLGQLRQVAEKVGGGVLVLALLSGAHDEELVRALLAVRKDLPEGSVVVPVPLAPRGDRDGLLAAHVAAAYGATHLFSAEPLYGAPLEVVVPEPWAYDVDVEVWRPVARIEETHARAELTRDELDSLLDRGEPIPEWFTPPAVAAELVRARPPKHERGVTVFFTGLSGSGKSTVARGLADALVEHGGRTVSLLDGDVVRQMLSSGLTFSKADRDLNIRRIGYVAAEITRHGGLAICAPIAPFAATRAEVRRMVETAGDFLLIHVATPLEECERRDRKGLYAKARAGLIPEFTGISSPYEAPDDADLVLDTTGLPVEKAVSTVLDLLTASGYLQIPTR
ncbi:bifunctional sulfate adenylyltransferase/adenylylsulfate kinase [Actinocorallia lasiicapitis]